MDGDRKIILVTRRTRLQELVARHNTVEQARFHAEHLDMDFGDFLEEDRTYQRAITAVVAILTRHGRLQRLDRGFLPNFLFPPECVVVVVGQDGLVANTLKYLQRQPVLAINPDPDRWEGMLLPFQVGDLASVLPEILQGRRDTREITMARVQLSDGQTLLAVNDVFIGMRSHVSARYEIMLGSKKERQSSSGVIISTGLGSTGWLRSVLTGAHAVAGTDAGREMREVRTHGMPWDSHDLVFNVREPYPSRSTGAGLIFGKIPSGWSLRIRSMMPENGVIFSDGIEADGLEFGSGLEAVVGIHPECGRLIQ
ncbi:sugar kinase [Pseudoxanthomonas sp. 22568]|uniref:sugar kinase n=1 Tax=Pseudoxanthomonas sp. 22568 TaxID=3453945 RepID=UPI003F828CCF